MAFLLTTNGQDPGVIQGKLAAQGAASGVQEIIKKSENISDVEDQRQLYSDNIPRVLYLAILWHNFLFEKKLLIPRLQKIGRIDLPEDAVTLKFLEAPHFMTEKEKLEVIEKRKGSRT